MFVIENIKHVLKDSPNACLVLHPDAPFFSIAYANDAFLRTANVNGMDLVGKGIFEVFPENPDDQSSSRLNAIKNSLTQALRLKKLHKILLQRYDLPKIGIDGFEVRYWNSDAYPIFDKSDNVQFIVFSPTDVSNSITALEDKKTDEYKTLIDKDFQHPLFNDYPDAVFTIDLAGNFLSANKVLIELAECPLEELIKMFFISFIDPEDFEMVFDNFQRAIKGEIQNFNTRIISAKGKRRIINVTNLPIIINQEVIGIYLVAKDITPIKQAELQLELYHQQISTILESIADGFFAVDQNWTVTYWNKEAENILNISRGNMMGKNLWEMYPEAITLKFYPAYHKAMSEQVSIRFEEYLPSTNIWLEVTVNPSNDGLSVYFKDITQRIKADVQLKEAKEKYQDLFDLNPLPNWVYDSETLNFLAVNQAAINHYGYSRAEFLSMSLKDIRPAEDFEILEKLIQDEVKSDCVHKSVSRHLKKSGEIIFVETNGCFISFGDRKGRLVLALDITEKLSAEQVLKTSEKRFKALIQDGSDLIAILNLEGIYQYVNSSSIAILGIDPEDFIGRNAFDFIHEEDDFIHEEDKERISQHFVDLSSQKCIKISPFRFLDNDGKYRWIETTITNMTEDPAVGGVVANSKDVTQQIENELKIKESMERYNFISKATNDAVYDWDVLSDVVNWGEGFKEIFNHPYEGPFNVDHWLSLLHPDDVERTKKDLLLHIENKESRMEHEYRFRCADGSYKFVMDRNFLLYNDDGKLVRTIGALQDITQRINYIQAIEAQNLRLSEISWMQSHVVRAPLARVIGLSELLNCDEENKAKKELLSNLVASAYELDQIIRDIVKKTETI